MALVLIPTRRRYPPPRAVRGLRGLGACTPLPTYKPNPLPFPIPAVPTSPRSRPRGFMGLGDCTAPISNYNGVPYCRDNISGSLVPCTDPGCSAPAAGGYVSNTPTFIPQGTPTYSTQQFGNSTTTTFTLASYMAQMVSQFTAQSPLSLQNQGITPATAAAQLMALAQQYCTAEGPSDCGQINAIVAAAAAQVAAAYAGVPASQWNPATFTDYAGDGGAPAQAPAQQQRSTGQLPPPTVSMRNLSRAGSDTQYQPGDQWQITITGAPGAAVSGSASQNGTNLGTSAFGNLNGAGQMVLTGTITADQAGTWVEGWTVAGNPPSITLSFSVAAAPAGAPAGKGAASGTSSGIPAGSAGGAVALPSFTLPDLSSIPSWAWYAGGGLILFMMFKK